MTKSDEKLYLNELSLFRKLYQRKDSNSLKQNVFKVYKKNQYIYYPGNDADKLFLIVRGRVKIGSFTNDHKVVLYEILETESVFGEEIIFGERKRRNFARALDVETKICIIPSFEIQEMMKDSQVLSSLIINHFGAKMKLYEEKINILMTRSMRARVIKFLKQIALEKGKKVGFETIIKGHYKHREIAHLIGTSRQNVTTILNELRSNNIINYDSRKILIRNLDLL